MATLNLDYFTTNYLENIFGYDPRPALTVEERTCIGSAVSNPTDASMTTAAVTLAEAVLKGDMLGVHFKNLSELNPRQLTALDAVIKAIDSVGKKALEKIVGLYLSKLAKLGVDVLNNDSIVSIEGLFTKEEGEALLSQIPSSDPSKEFRDATKAFNKLFPDYIDPDSFDPNAGICPGCTNAEGAVGTGGGAGGGAGAV